MNCFTAWLFCTLMVLLQIRCGEAQSRIVGGHLLKPDQRQKFSFLVSLQYHKPNPITDISGYDHVCQGTLIYAQFIVTAAHCFSNKTFEGLQNLEDWTAVAGEYDLGGYEGVEQTRDIVEIFFHPKFNVTWINFLDMSGYISNWDIALLKVDRPFQLNPYVSTLGYDPTCVREGDKCAITGWGMLENETFPRYPFEATIFMPGPRYCHEIYDSINPIVAEGPKFCARGPDLAEGNTGPVGDACEADSGGPFVCTCKRQGSGLILTGIVSFGIGCGSPEYPGVYTDLKVRRIFDFIWNTTGENM